MLRSLNGIIYLLLFLCQLTLCAKKVRYEKYEERKRSQNDIYAFLGMLDSSYVVPLLPTFEPTPFTTPNPTTIRSETISHQAILKRRLVDYCLESRGQFVYGPNCHKYVDCWVGQAFLKSCSPETLVFEPGSGQCLWSWDSRVQGRCTTESTITTTERINEQNTIRPSQPATDFNLPACNDFSHLGYKCVEDYLCPSGEIRNISDINLLEFAIDVRSGVQPLEPKGKFSPWTKTCESNYKICCKDPNFVSQVQVGVRQGRVFKPSRSTPLCPVDYSGLQPYPSDCTKFTNCWKGKAFVQDCAPGTLFNADSGQCDFPHKANCQSAAISNVAFSYSESRFFTKIRIDLREFLRLSYYFSLTYR